MELSGVLPDIKLKNTIVLKTTSSLKLFFFSIKKVCYCNMPRVLMMGFYTNIFSSLNTKENKET